MTSEAKTVKQYLSELPEDRRGPMTKLRAVFKKNLPKGFAESMQYGMIAYSVPHSLYPAGYHCDPTKPLPFAAIASQKNYISVYLMSAYADSEVEASLRKSFAGAGRKLDMGKCCLRFKKPDEIPFDIIGKAIAMVSVADWIRQYESTIKQPRRQKNATA
jgi:Domain of unknown function (DU1801)